jgi:hypothetical protein
MGIDTTCMITSNDCTHICCDICKAVFDRTEYSVSPVIPFDRGTIAGFGNEYVYDQLSQ